jgi:hypothetical protein
MILQYPQNATQEAQQLMKQLPLIKYFIYMTTRKQSCLGIATQLVWPVLE